MKENGNKSALLVGINDYGGAHDLRGCINDVTNIRNVLKTFFGFDNEDIRVLTDQRATKRNILMRLEQMISYAEAGDVLVFHFSGHGSQIRDRNNDELKDHLDEILCPCDMNWDNGFISDDMVGGLVEQLPSGVFMEIILDCCHAGTATRFDAFGQPEEPGPFFPVINRYWPPPMDISARFSEQRLPLKAKRAFRDDPRITRHHVLWAGCQDHQTSADALINGSYNGAFTYYLCQQLSDDKHAGPRSDVIMDVRQSLMNHHYGQTPQLECPASFRSLPFMAYTPAKKTAGSSEN